MQVTARRLRLEMCAAMRCEQTLVLERMPVVNVMTCAFTASSSHVV